MLWTEREPVVRVRLRCPALPVADEAGQKHVQRSKFCEPLANRKFRVPQTDAGTMYKRVASASLFFALCWMRTRTELTATVRWTVTHPQFTEGVTSILSHKGQNANSIRFLSDLTVANKMKYNVFIVARISC